MYPALQPLTVDVILIMFLPCQLPPFRIYIGHLRQFSPFDNIHVQYLWIFSPVHTV